MYTKTDILARSDTIGNAHQAGLCATVQCCVLGAEAPPDSLIVSVPIHPGYEDQPRNIDLDIDQYLENAGPMVGVRALNTVGVCLEQYPHGAPRRQKYSWSIFYVNQSNPLRPRNRMYDSLKVETAATWPLRSVYSNIVVVKSTREGRVCNVEEKDRSLIEMLVYSFPTHTDDALDMQLHRRRGLISSISDRVPCLFLIPPMQSPVQPHPIYHGDVLMNMVPHFHWANLVMLLNFPFPGPELAEKEMRLRIFEALKTFIPPSDIPEFFDVLDLCEGAVVGSCFPGRLSKSKPFDLNVALGHDREDPMNSFLSRLGFQSTVQDPVKEICGDSVGRVEVYRKRIGTKVVQITALVSKAEALSVVLRSPFTGQMNALTSTTIGSYYPRLMFRNESLCLEGFDLSKLPPTIRPPTFALFPDNSHWTNACGVYCPATWRKTYNDRGLARYRWSVRSQTAGPAPLWGMPPDVDPRHEQLWKGELLSWKMRRRCANPHCPNMVLYDSRQQFLLS
ncbi:hypothetical protein DFP72DRAFT_849572 [Ephemerocybe angulata]|uniref:Uncharacterized protein n=1 Tax=Ephemerocybe angulata TaxID=980116 RepID=A0A8H6HUU0_9AGAR|nr:hypothetical protein DFP72DRAFT_849572 [Tulosesus angulatus]